MKLILTGGFLGSGKTTAIQQACSLLLRENKTVAVVTNDQGEDMVDSKLIQGLSIPLKEVTHGCFCCNYNALLQHIYYFSEHINPEIVFAESVGSCTDLVATIAKPLAEMHPGFAVNISVFVDAHLLHSLISGTSFFIDDAVRYIFKKQMEEADILILNKIDLLDRQQLEEVQQVIQQDYPAKRILLQNSLNEHDVERWLNEAQKEQPAKRTSLDIDYEIYGAGEAKLAWLDAVLAIQTQKLPATKTAALLAEIMHQKIQQRQLTIGHLKYLIDDGKQQFKLSFTTIDHPESILLKGTSNRASVIINARVQTTPDMLQQIMHEAIDDAALKTNCSIVLRSVSAFQPGFPRPTHRIEN
jgi:G3E family GTPase